MRRRILFRSSFAIAWILLVAVSLNLNAQENRRGRKYKAPPDTARIEVTILRDFNGKPIENAAVIFHPMQGERDKGNMELKTNEDGKTVIDVLPIGDTVRMQVIAKGFQTYGGDYKLDKPELAIEVRMKRPGEQYSIYKAHTPGADQNAGQGTETAPDSPTDKPADPNKGKSSSESGPEKDKAPGSSGQPTSQPNSSQPQSN